VAEEAGEPFAAERTIKEEDRARARGRRQVGGVALDERDAREPQARGESARGGDERRLHVDADVVLCTEVLEHVLDPRAMLAEAHGALRPGGRLLLTVPFAARWHFVPHDYWRFTPSSLKHLLEGAGFRDVVVWARGNALTVACYKAMALLLPLLMPQNVSAGKSVALRLLGLPTVPPFVALAVVANLSLRARGGDDCLGYTVTATRPEAA